MSSLAGSAVMDAMTLPRQPSKISFNTAWPTSKNCKYLEGMTVAHKDWKQTFLVSTSCFVRCPYLTWKKACLGQNISALGSLRIFASKRLWCSGGLPLQLHCERGAGWCPMVHPSDPQWKVCWPGIWNHSMPQNTAQEQKRNLPWRIARKEGPWWNPHQVTQTSSSCQRHGLNSQQACYKAFDLVTSIVSTNFPSVNYAIQQVTKCLHYSLITCQADFQRIMREDARKYMDLQLCFHLKMKQLITLSKKSPDDLGVWLPALAPQKAFIGWNMWIKTQVKPRKFSFDPIQATREGSLSVTP